MSTSAEFATVASAAYRIADVLETTIRAEDKFGLIAEGERNVRLLLGLDVALLFEAVSSFTCEKPIATGVLLDFTIGHAAKLSAGTYEPTFSAAMIVGKTGQPHCAEWSQVFAVLDAGQITADVLADFGDAENISEAVLVLSNALRALYVYSEKDKQWRRQTVLAGAMTEGEEC